MAAMNGRPCTTILYYQGKQKTTGWIKSHDFSVPLFKNTPGKHNCPQVCYRAEQFNMNFTICSIFQQAGSRDVARIFSLGEHGESREGCKET